MVAGVDKDARGEVEASVRQGLGARAEHGPWSVSVVSLAGKWSVTLDGPEDRLRGLSCVADPSGLAEAIREAVHGNGAAHASAAALDANSLAAGPATTAAPLATEARDRHACDHCGKAVLVVYEQRAGEGKAMAAVACPHCWQVGHVEIDAWAAAGGEYRAEKG